MPDFDKFLEGAPGQSNWPSEHFEEHGRKTPKLQKRIHFIDVAGETMARATTFSGARTVARKLRAQFPGAKIEIRPYSESEEDAEAAYQRERKRHWESIVYKPTPSRRSR